MDYETVSADDFGASLRGIGLNLLVPDIAAEVRFLETVLGMTAHRVSADFAILAYGAQVLQLHVDATYANHPLFALLPETPPRGAGASLHAFDSDPDAAEGMAEANGGMILQTSTNKPHGLREACILSPAGYAWLASRPLTDDERKAIS